MTLVHLLRPPAAGAGPPPAVVLLHGIGADEHDLFALAPRLDPRLLVVSPRAPHPAPPGHAWWEVDWTARPPRLDPAQAEASREALAAFVAEVVGAHGADPRRVFLFGFSQGAMMALGLLLTRPDLVAGAVAHSGRLLPQFLARAAPAPALGRAEALVLHGVHDDVVPVAHGREAAALLAPLLGARVAYREHEVAHGISEESLADAAAWLAARAGP